jgi:hypothetical protein
MDRTELRWRMQTRGRTLIDRCRTQLTPPRWNRGDLLEALDPSPAMRASREALQAGDWLLAHRELSRHFVEAPQRFVIGADTKSKVTGTVRSDFPGSPAHAIARAERLLAGEYDLLGYRGLRFDDSTSTTIDWHLDPVHGRRPPQTFWSTIPYLAPECGDHKIIWELNRHQHWLTLGRAFWLTDDRRYRERFVSELDSWLVANPPLVGINWSSMLELALRSLSWIWALHFFVEDPSAVDAGAPPDSRPWTLDLMLAIDRQLNQIERNLSRYFSPNTHLLGEGLALYVSGAVLPELAASRRRQEVGLHVLLTEIDRQIAKDGGHLERSTHYHRYTLDFYMLALAVARITNDPAADTFAEAVSRLGFAARVLADDQGRLPHIGDDDGGMLMPMTGRSADDVVDSLAIAASLVNRPELAVGRGPEEVHWMLSHPEATAASTPGLPSPAAFIGSVALADTGYYVSRTASGDHLVIDGGAHGYQNAGHAHADALSITFSVGGLPLLIDAGTGCYTTNPAVRDRFRSTALHNTLTIDDRPQSIPNGPFHWSHIANGSVRRWRTHQRFDYFDGTHDGFGPLAHRRCVLSLHDDLLIVADLVDGPGVPSAATYWQMDPRWTLEIGSANAVFTQGQRIVTLTVSQGAIESFFADTESGLGWHSPVYGRIEGTTTLRVSRRDATPFWMVSVFGLDPHNAVTGVQILPARRSGLSLALRIGRVGSTDELSIADPASPVDRIGDMCTDAAMLFHRRSRSQGVECVALVDGSAIHTAGPQPFDLDLPHRVPTFFAADVHRPLPFTEDRPCAALPVS